MRSNQFDMILDAVMDYLSYSDAVVNREDIKSFVEAMCWSSHGADLLHALADTAKHDAKEEMLNTIYFVAAGFSEDEAARLIAEGHGRE